MVERDKMVVAVLRPSDPSVASLPKSRDWCAL
jgi:hypothetical protein